jgi:chromosomal replication initiator protein
MNYYVAPGLFKKELIKFTKCKSDKIIDLICTNYKVSFDDIKSKSRKRNVVMARQLICYFIYEHTKLTLIKVAEMLNRDHSTIIYSKDIVKELCFSDKAYRQHFEHLEKLI